MASNHIVVRVEARKFTTHEPDDFDKEYLDWMRGQIQEKLESMKFLLHRVTVTVERD